MIPVADALRSTNAGPTVYRLYDAKGGLLYVGFTEGLAADRLRSHRRNGKWGADIQAAAFERFPSRSEGLAAEAAAIAAEAPRYNRLRPRIDRPEPRGLTPAQLAAIERQGAEYARRSRREQGLPEQVEDPTTYAELARLLVRSEERTTATPRSAA